MNSIFSNYLHAMRRRALRMNRSWATKFFLFLGVCGAPFLLVLGLRGLFLEQTYFFLPVALDKTASHPFGIVSGGSALALACLYLVAATFLVAVVFPLAYYLFTEE